MFGFLYFGSAPYAGLPGFGTGTAVIPITPVVPVVVVLSPKSNDGGVERPRPDLARARRLREIHEEELRIQAEADEEEDIELITTMWLHLK